MNARQVAIPYAAHAISQHCTVLNSVLVKVTLMGNSMSNHPDGETMVSGIYLTFTSKKGTDEINKIQNFASLAFKLQAM